MNEQENKEKQNVFRCKKCSSIEYKNPNRLEIEPMATGISYKEILVLLGVRKVAKQRICDWCGATEVSCPFCLKKATVLHDASNYKCPYCCQKSYITTSVGIMSLFRKKYNDIAKTIKHEEK